MTPRRRPALAAALLTAAASATTACSAMVPATHVLGPSVGDVTVLADPPAVPAVRCAMRRYVVGKARGIKLGTATPGAIAAAVKNGEPTDLVIIPAGAALDRVRDELATPPTQIHIQPGGTTWWVAAVTDKGLGLARFLSSRQGRSLLSSSQCATSANGHTG
jgi:hypothetical protein